MMEKKNSVSTYNNYNRKNTYNQRKADQLSSKKSDAGSVRSYSSKGS